MGNFEHFGRKHPVHQPLFEAGNQSPIIFLTVTADRRRAILDKADAVETILKSWRESDAWRVGRYVVMPDHVHLFCAPSDLTVSLSRWVKFWKSAASRCWPRRQEQPVWQLDFWDTQLRREESYTEKWDYVWRNPVR